jgi:hypothetical protein
VAKPSAHSKKTAEKICLLIASGQSLREICKDTKLPAMSTVLLWVANNREGFSEQYAKACEARLYFHAEELIDIADDGTNDWMERNEGDNAGWKANGEAINRSRLRVDTRKWILAKLLPKYKDKPEQNDSGDMATILSKLIDKLPN